MITLKQPKVLVLNPPIARGTRRKKVAFLAFRAVTGYLKDPVISPGDVGALDETNQSAGTIESGQVAVRVVQVLIPGQANPTIDLPQSVAYPYFVIGPT